MKFRISEDESRQARHPHELFLINLITNHILLFVGLLGMAGSVPALMLIIPGISVVILSYLIIKAKRALTAAPWFVACHWQLCAKRSKFFIFMILGVAAAIGLLILSVGGDPAQLKPGHKALGGLLILPVMLSVLVLVVMESDAVHKAKVGELPDWLVERYPNPAMQQVEAAFVDAS